MLIALVVKILLEIAVRDRPIPTDRDINPDLMSKFTLADLGNAWLLNIPHLCSPLTLRLRNSKPRD